MPAGGLAFRPQPDLMTFREIAEHILHAGRGLTGLLLDGETELNTPDFREKLKRFYQPLPEDAAAAAIAEEMRKAVEEDCARLALQPPEFFSEIITRFDGARVTRLEMMQFVKEHELAHRAQLFLYLRLNGVVPPTTRRKLASRG
jgi:uncharacterized damage-inducible protein DinB